MAELTFKEFEKFRELIYDSAGITLADNKMELVQARVGRRVNHHGFKTYDEYYSYVTADKSGGELVHLLDAISINLTSFFREPSHFEFMNEVLPGMLAAKQKAGDRRIRIWSAGCSTGEEPYTIAMCLLEHTGNAGWDAKVLATDLSTRVLAIAQQGVYGADRIATVPPALAKTHFKRGTGEWSDHFRVSDHLSAMVVFRRLNLMEKYPFKGPFDFIFCRNVMIYFSRDIQQSLVKRYHDFLGPGGYLFIGHSESLSSLEHKFTYVRPTIYKK